MKEIGKPDLEMEKVFIITQTEKGMKEILKKINLLVEVFFITKTGPGKWEITKKIFLQVYLLDYILMVKLKQLNVKLLN